MALDPKTKFKLFKINKNFCSVPWNLLHINPLGELNICTSSKFSSLGELNTSSIKEIHANPALLQLKADMLANNPIPSCSACHSQENEGDGVTSYKHLRNMYNEKFLKQDVDYTDVSAFTFSALDLHWSSICDLKCVTCWAGQSSSIAQEQGLPTHHTKTSVALELIDTIIENQYTLKEVYLSGGEPSLIKYNLNLLSRLEKRDDLLLRINTNMMWDQDNAIIQEALKFPKVLFTCSADNLYNKFEYIRRGAKWNRFVENLNYISNRENVEVRINSVFFVLNALDLVDTIDYFSENHKISNFTINQCQMGHTYLRPRNLSSAIKEQALKKLEQAKLRYGHNITLVGSFTNCVAELNESATESYQEYFDNIDLLANSDFKTTFPELV
jgi:MoaA/NifB/PqqE/SkfB family radical SAM enzyme